MRIKALRDNINMQQKELALELDIPSNTLSQYENGKREPNIDILRKISDFFHVTTDYLIGRTDFIQCPICHNTYDPLNKFDSAEHDAFHEKFVAAQNKFGEILLYATADKERSKCITKVRNPALPLEQRLSAYDKYLKYEFMLDLWKTDFDINHDSFEDFSKKEASSVHPDSLISEELCEMIYNQYEVEQRSNIAQFTSRDNRDIKKDLDSIKEKLSSKEYGPAAYDGEELSEESVSLFMDELEIALKRLKLINKEKYNPHKNKK